MLPYLGVIYHMTQLGGRRNDTHFPATSSGAQHLCPGIASLQAFCTYALGKGPLGLMIFEVMTKHCLAQQL